MPIYDYRCVACGGTYDVFHKVREVKEDVLCPACGSQEHQRLLSAPNVAVGTRSSSSPVSAPSCDTPGGCCSGSCGMN